ncbi:MAG: tetratricopeptide repeat protein [Flavobacteriales bacterium]|nr:tetratricopeptide repeat protein [Flavobacteriales bacterium]
MFKIARIAFPLFLLVLFSCENDNWKKDYRQLEHRFLTNISIELGLAGAQLDSLQDFNDFHDTLLQKYRIYKVYYYIQSNNYTQANKDLELIEIAGIKDARTLKLYRTTIVEYLIATRSFDDAEKVMKQMDHEFTSSGNLEFLALSQLYWAALMEKKGLYDSALVYYEEFESKYGEIDNKSIAFAQGLLLKSICLTSTGQISKAIEPAYQSLRIFQDSLSTANQITALNMIGGIQYHMEQFDSAENTFNQALNLCNTSETEGFSYTMLTNLAGVYLNQGRYHEALENNIEVLEYERGIGDTSRLIKGYGNLAEVYLLMGAKEDALKTLDSALYFMREFGDSGSIMLHYARLGRIYAEESIETGISYLEKAYNMALQRGDFLNLKVTSDEIRKVLEHNGKFREALKYADLNRRWSDSILNVENQRLINELKIQYETDLKTAENLRLEQALDLEENRSKFYGLSFVLAIIAALFIYVAFLLIKNRNKVLNHQRIIDAMHFEKLETEKRQLKENLDQITDAIKYKNSLVETYKSVISEDEKAGQRILSKLNTDDDWSNYLIEFELLHPNFFKTLISSGEGINNTDLRIASLVQLNLNNDEIGALMNITYEGAKKAKTRLKKKLQLERTDDLLTFFNNLHYS